MSSNRHRLVIFFLCLALTCKAQVCFIDFGGTIYDSSTKEKLEFVSVFIEELETGILCDSMGNFLFKDLCPGNYHLTFSHVGCASKNIYIELTENKTMEIFMDHHDHQFEDLLVVAKRIQGEQNQYTINEQNIEEQALNSLADISEKISGVSILKTGAGINKPIIQGMYGNRISILNNGITQAGQQWGNDHAPEIDPLVANKITVIKGVSALEYMGSNLGGVLLVEPTKINRDPHLHGKSGLFFESNGRGLANFLQLQQYKDKAGWKVHGSYKRSGDKHSPNYYLRNTGLEQLSFALQYERNISDNLFADLYFSTFHTQIGILRGSHIGNLTDLERAIGRDIPFFTEEEFTYSIDAPRQKVSHQLFKSHLKWIPSVKQVLDLNFGAQLNRREEYDIRRGGRSSRPSIDMIQWSAFGEAKYKHEVNKVFDFKTGMQFFTKNNDNQPNTGVLPLIPSFVSIGSAAYALMYMEKNNQRAELGLRYNYEQQRISSIANTLPKSIVRVTNNFHNLSALLSYSLDLGEESLWSTNIGYAKRNPFINEMFSDGLHQGVSGYEVGDPDLVAEKSLKLSSTFYTDLNEKLHLEVQGYFQSIADYIYLQPQDEYVYTIRGAFPLFKYEQALVNISGLDLTSKYSIGSGWSLSYILSLIKGKNIDKGTVLINLPSSNMKAELKYEHSKTINLGKLKLENSGFDIEADYTTQQKQITEELDFVAAPEDYLLLHLKYFTTLQMKKRRLRFQLQVRNLLNTTYRDYLNRQRYFADELGRNISLGLQLKF